MKRLQPYTYVVILACLFILAGLVFFGLQLWPGLETGSTPVDPKVVEQDNGLYDLWFSRTNIYDLNTDYDLSRIIFSAENNRVTLLDRGRKLIWDRSFSTAPQQAKISSCGRYIAVGTAGGLLYFTSIDKELQWENEGGSVELIDISPAASWVVAVRRENDDDADNEANELNPGVTSANNDWIELYDQNGNLQWKIQAPGWVEDIFLVSEHLDQANIYYTFKDEAGHGFAAMDLEGHTMWEHAGQDLAAVSRHGSRLAAVDGNTIIVYDFMGQLLWETDLPFEAINILFNPHNYNRLLVYGNREGGGENLYYFDLSESLLWMKRVADGSHLAFVADGQRIITGSWRHYKEDFTQMMLIDQAGEILNSWEVAMRVEHLIISSHPDMVLVCGEDGYIDLIDLQPLLVEAENNGVQVSTVYNPVSTGLRTDEHRVTLYFSNDRSDLIPVTRTISFTDNPLQSALEELVLGPARGSALYRTIPDKEAEIQATFSSKDGHLTLDLPPELLEVAASAQGSTALKSLIMTVSAFPEVEEIYLTAGEEPLTSFGQDLILEMPLLPKRWKNPIYVPSMSGNRYYLQVEEAAGPGFGTPTLESLLDQALRKNRIMPFVPVGLRVLELEVAPEQIRIDLNDSFKEVFPEELTEQDRLQAALLLDSIFLTVFANSRSQRAEILVEGESWSPPVGYPSLSRFFRRPFFINPEP